MNNVVLFGHLLLDDSPSRLASYGSSALIVVVLALMVFKP